MRLIRLLAVFLCLVPLSTAQGAQQRMARPWTRVVATTPDGGFRIGNPDAKVKLVEYASLTCPHCRAFDEEAWLPLSAYVRKGSVSYEFRNYILNGLDVAASLVARCNGTASFFPTARELYATQPQWVGKVAALSRAERDAIGTLPEEQRPVRVAEIAGLIAIGQKHGVTPAKARACLRDKAALDRLDQMHDRGQALGVEGTPTFFINGGKLDANTWPGVAAAIESAGG